MKEGPSRSALSKAYPGEDRVHGSQPCLVGLCVGDIDAARDTRNLTSNDLAVTHEFDLRRISLAQLGDYATVGPATTMAYVEGWRHRWRAGLAAGDLRPDVGAEGTDFGSNGGHIAGRETFGAVVSLPILPNARIGGYRAYEMLG